MKRTLTILLLTSLLFLNTGTVKASPFIRNFTTKEYNAHNRCFDVLCDKYGTVFVATSKGFCIMMEPLGERFTLLASTG